MTCWVVIPIKALDECKTRLRLALNDAERQTLVRAMLNNVLKAAQGTAAVSAIGVLGPNWISAPASVARLEDSGQGLNAELNYAASALPADVTRLIVLASDLPQVTSADIEALAHAEGVAIGPDRAGLGTNALSLPLPQARTFRFRFGEGSLALHTAEAARLKLPLHIIQTETLALDIDTPADLEILRAGV